MVLTTSIGTRQSTIRGHGVADLSFHIIASCRTHVLCDRGRRHSAAFNRPMGLARDARILAVSPSTNTAGNSEKQRAVRCYFRLSIRQKSRISAAYGRPPAVNSGQEQRKQRAGDPSIRREWARRAGCGRAGPRGEPSRGESRRAARWGRDGAAYRRGCRCRSTSGRGRPVGIPSLHR